MQLRLSVRVARICAVVRPVIPATAMAFIAIACAGGVWAAEPPGRFLADTPQDAVRDIRVIDPDRRKKAERDSMRNASPQPVEEAAEIWQPKHPAERVVPATEPARHLQRGPAKPAASELRTR
jgi:hypothetical protein